MITFAQRFPTAFSAFSAVLSVLNILSVLSLLRLPLRAHGGLVQHTYFRAVLSRNALADNCPCVGTGKHSLVCVLSRIAFAQYSDHRPCVVHQCYVLSHGHIQNAWSKQEDSSMGGSIQSGAFVQNACSGSRGAFVKRAQAPGRAFVRNACMVSSGTRGTGGFWCAGGAGNARLSTLDLFSSRSTPRILKEGALKPTLRYASPCPIFVRPTALLVHSSSTLRPPYGAPRPLFVRPTAPYGARYTGQGHGERSKAQSHQ